MVKLATERQVEIPAREVQLKGMLALPENAPGVVLFAHGSGSGRFSPRNQFVAAELRNGGLGTLLMDLLSEREAADRRCVFDIDLLADRLLYATDWLQRQPETRDLAIGYFGASTGAAAALKAAAKRPGAISAIVSRGGRPDLAPTDLPNVTAPTLLVVGGEDYPVIPLNRQAFERLTSKKELIVVPRATHLFEEPGALEEVSRLAREWFTENFAARESTEEEQ